jgi:AcrR family transcriptional regulator
VDRHDRDQPIDWLNSKPIGWKRQGVKYAPWVTSAEPVAVSRLRPIPYSAAQTRVIAAALGLFTTHGVGGTSLQMIADAVGITKASVYYQFKTKEEIVIAAAEVDLARLEQAIDAAEAAENRPQALEVLLARLVDLAVEHRGMVSMLQNDPVMVRLVAEHEPFRELMDRLHHLLVGDDPSTDQRVPAAMISAAIGSAATHPLVVDLDDDTLRANLLDLARRFLQLPEDHG